MMDKKLTVGLFFGGRSVEHEVSVITALQAYEHLDKDKYLVIPIYVSKSGQFFTNHKFLDLKNYKDINSLLLYSKQIVLAHKKSRGGFLTQGIFGKFTPLDIAFPMFHGTFGEDGCIQGLFEIYQVPYVGFNVTGAALSMDKVAQKAIYKEIGLNVGKYAAFNRNDFFKDPKTCIRVILSGAKNLKTNQEISHFVRNDNNQGLRFPLFVKPGTIGSSIGINKAKDEDELQFNIEVAATYSEKILIENAFEDCIEVNCSAMGYGVDVKASVCEQPVASSEILSFEDKYKKGGKGGKSAGMASLSRIIPAPISPKLTKQIQEATVKIFKALDGCGVARVDYFVDPKAEKFWVNEINTPPGSLAFYLWEKSGLKYKDLLDKLIGYALERFEDQKKTQYTFESGLLSQMALSGGSKK